MNVVPGNKGVQNASYGVGWTALFLISNDVGLAR